MQGTEKQVAEALGRGDLDAALLAETERALLRYVELLTLHSYKATAADAQALRDAGWSDSQIAECVYITALFAFFNRVADAFGLENSRYETILGLKELQRKNRPH